MCESIILKGTFRHTCVTCLPFKLGHTAAKTKTWLQYFHTHYSATKRGFDFAWTAIGLKCTDSKLHRRVIKGTDEIGCCSKCIWQASDGRWEVLLLSVGANWGCLCSKLASHFFSYINQSTCSTLDLTECWTANQNWLSVV